MKSLIAIASFSVALVIPAMALTESECASKIDQLDKAIGTASNGTESEQVNKVKNAIAQARTALDNKDMATCESATSAGMADLTKSN